jgi:Major Facilitator Superfamily
VLTRVLPPPGPARTLALISLVNTTGSGLWFTSSMLYLTTHAGLSPAAVGVGFAAAAGVSLVASTPMGYLADSRGPRGVEVFFYALLGLLYLPMLAVRSAATFVVVAALIALADAGQRGARGALIAGCVPREQRVRARAVNRMMANLGYTIGGALAGVAIAIGTRSAYEWLIVGNAVSYLAIAAVARTLPYLEPTGRQAAEPRLKALRDSPFLTFVALDGLMTVHGSILEVAIPLWITTHTGAPTWVAAACFILNTAMVVLLQVRTSRGTETVPGSVRATRSAGLLVAASCVVFAVSSGHSAVPATALLLLAAFVHVLGELRHSAAGWGLSFGLAPAVMQGQYQATYAMGAQLAQVVAPPLLVLLIVHVGAGGWLILALFVLVPALLMGPVVRWNQRRSDEGRASLGLAPA